MRNANPMMVAVLLTTIVGCTDSDQRLVEMAKEHEKSQAEQSQQMARMQHEVAEGGKKLIEADAKARENLTAMQHDLRTDQAEIGHQRDQLENDRRAIAAQRRVDPIVAAAIMDVGIGLACLLPLILGIYVLRSACRAGESDSAVAELLVQELVASKPRLSLPGHPSLPAIEHQAVVDSLPGGGDDAEDRPAD